MSIRDSSQTAHMLEIIDDMIDNRLYNLHTTMPAKVVSIDKASGLLSVQPSFKRQFADSDEPEDYPVIPGVTLGSMRAGNAIISMPVKVGDFVTLWFSERSMETWKESGKTAVPPDTRAHHLSDAIAYPGNYPISMNIKNDPEALQIKYGSTKISLKEDSTLDLECSKAKIHMTKAGKFSIGNGSVELLSLLEDALTQVKMTSTAIKVMTMPTGLGPSGVPINALSFTNVEIAVDKILNLLSQLME